MLVQHSSISNEHYTPLPVLQAAKATIGQVDLDPASNVHWNDYTQLAKKIYTKDDDGLSHEWYGKVFVNPPGKTEGRRSSQAVWFEKLYHHYQNNDVTDAVFVAFNLEIIRHCHEILYLPTCVPFKRLRFWSYDHINDTYREGQYNVKGKWTNAPSHANIIAYMGNNPEAFKENFQHIGHIKL